MTAMKQLAKDNKFATIVIGAVASGLLAWGIWVTQGVFTGDKGFAVHIEKINNVCMDIAEVKGQVDALRAKVESQSVKLDVQAAKMDTQVLKTEANQQEILRVQEQILRELRKKGNY